MTGTHASGGWTEYVFSKKLKGSKFDLFIEKTSDDSYNYMCIKQLEMQIIGKERFTKANTISISKKIFSESQTKAGNQRKFENLKKIEKNVAGCLELLCACAMPTAFFSDSG